MKSHLGSTGREFPERLIDKKKFKAYSFFQQIARGASRLRVFVTKTTLMT